MKIISHRGNLTGPEKQYENNPDRIDYCISLGLDVEVDVWDLNGQWFLGHDYPHHKIDIEFLKERKNNLWIHCKNVESLNLCFSTDLNYFWHENDTYTLTSKKYIWTYPGKELTNNSVSVMPEWDISIEKLSDYKPNCYGVCSDYISLIA